MLGAHQRVGQDLRHVAVSMRLWPHVRRLRFAPRRNQGTQAKILFLWVCSMGSERKKYRASAPASGLAGGIQLRALTERELAAKREYMNKLEATLSALKAERKRIGIELVLGKTPITADPRQLVLPCCQARVEEVES